MNILVVGRNSSGKTSRILIKEINEKINNNESFFFLDSKEEYYKHYQKELESKGYKINIVNLRDCMKSNSWNPLTLPYKLFKDNKDKSIEMLKNIGTCIFYDETVNDPFWINACADLFVGFSLLLFKEAKEDAINLYSVNNMAANEEVFEKLLESLDKMDPIYLSLSEILLAPKETRDSIFTVFRQNMNIYLIYENLSSLLSYTDYDLRKITSDKVALFFINKDEKKSINNLADIYINQIYEIIVNNKILNKFNFVLDNLDTIPIVQNFNQMLSVSNSRNFDVYSTSRDVEWFKDKYEFKNIDIVYNLDNIDAVVKVEKEQKRKYSINEYPIIELNKEANYPTLVDHPKFLFNLKLFVNQNQEIADK